MTIKERNYRKCGDCGRVTHKIIRTMIRGKAVGYLCKPCRLKRIYGD